MQHFNHSIEGSTGQQQTSEEFVPCLKNDNQYNSLSFGGTSNPSVPQASNYPPNISNINTSGNFQDNMTLFNDLFSNAIETNRNSFEMNTSEIDEEAEEVRTHLLENAQSSCTIRNDNSERTDATQFYGNAQMTTNDNTLSDEQPPSMLDFCHQFAQKFCAMVEELGPILMQNPISPEYTDCLKNFQLPLTQYDNMAFQKPLEMLGSILHIGFCQYQNCLQAFTADSIGQELDETAEQRISAPDELNNDHLNQQLQTATQLNLSTSSIPKDTVLPTLPASLSQLLSQAIKIVGELAELKVVEQPQEFWRKRSINCVKSKWCPAIQGRSGKQRHYIRIKWSKLPDCDFHNLFIHVQLLTHDNLPHSLKVLVPPETTVKGGKLCGKKKHLNIRQTLSDLIVKDLYGYDKRTNTILCPIDEKEWRQHAKNLKVLMFNLYKTSAEIACSNEENEADEGSENEEENISIEDQLLKLCKLRVCLCRRTTTGELEKLSNFIDTELIEESKGTKSLAIDPSELTPKYLCKCGNETITVLLNTDSEKAGFIIRLNDAQLESSQVRGVKDKKISFNSVSNTISGTNYLHVVVSKESILKTIMLNHDPYDGLDENNLLDVHVVYVEHSDNPHEHKDTNTESSNQSAESCQTESLLW